MRKNRQVKAHDEFVSRSLPTEMRRSLVHIAFLLTMVSKGFALAQEADVEKLIAGADPAIKEQFQRTYGAFFDSPGTGPESNYDAYRRLQTLKDQTKDKGEIVKQVAIFAVTGESEEGAHEIGALAILGALHLPQSIPIRVLAPYLDSDHARLRRFVRDWFEAHDKLDHWKLHPDIYNEYAGYVGQRIVKNEEIPTAFIEYIYERSPGRALLVFQRGNRQVDLFAKLLAMREKFDAARQQREKGQDEVLQQPERGQDEILRQREKKRQDELRQQRKKKEQNEILAAEHIVSNSIWVKDHKIYERFPNAIPDATAELAKLAKHKDWWVRLYVAWIMRQHRVLREPAIVQQLTTDSNELVSKAAKSAIDKR